MAATLDVVTYAGEINMRGYEALCAALALKKSDHVLLVIATPGGDPHAGFRIARALQHSYDAGFEALVPRYCKSAGTLLLIGATKLYLDDKSELGPLDVQVKKGDELVGRNSGLDIFQAMNFLQNQAIGTFSNYLHELARLGLSTRVGSDIACKLTAGLLEPIAAQIDPIKLAEMQRATEIAFEYGNRLNEKSGMMKASGIQKLVTGYPSHGFVIDRKEARTIFAKVERPQGLIDHLSKALAEQMEAGTNAAVPTVLMYNFPLGQQEIHHEDATPDLEPSQSGTAPGEPAIHGDLPANDAVAGNGAPDDGQPGVSAEPNAEPGDQKPIAAGDAA